MSSMDKGNGGTAPISKPVFYVSSIVVAFVVAFMVLFEDSAKGVIDNIFNFTTNQLGFTYVWFTMFAFGVCLWLAFGKYKHVKFGGPDAVPEFGRLSWIAMFFCAGIGTALLYWSSIEWSYYYASPPFGVAAKTPEAAEWAAMYGMFHWGPLGWVIYVITAFPIGYAFYNRGAKSLRLSTACAGVIGEGNAQGGMGRFIDILFILGLIGGTGTSLGSGTPMLAEAVSNMFGMEHTFTVDIAVVVVWTAIFTTSVSLGLKKGIKVLSDINVWAVFALCGIIMAVGPTFFMIDVFTDSMGLMADNFFRMAFYVDPIQKTKFPQWWTIFYWAWYVAYGPYMGIFIARISKGRTFQEVVGTVLIAGSLGCALFFTVFGNNAMYAELNGTFNFLEVMKEQSASAAIIGALNSLPLSALILPLFVFVGFVYSATTVDSSAYTIATVASHDIKQDQEPVRFNRMTWAIALGGIALVLMNIGGLKALKTASLAVAFPLMIAMILAIFSLFKWLKEDQPHLLKPSGKGK